MQNYATPHLEWILLSAGECILASGEGEGGFTPETGGGPSIPDWVPGGSGGGGSTGGGSGSGNTGSGDLDDGELPMDPFF